MTSMKSTVGRPRTLTDEQVKKVLDWYTSWLALKAQRAKVPTLRQVAKELGVSFGAVLSAVRRKGQFKQASPEHREVTLRERRVRVALVQAKRIGRKR